MEASRWIRAGSVLRHLTGVAKVVVAIYLAYLALTTFGGGKATLRELCDRDIPDRYYSSWYAPGDDVVAAAIFSALAYDDSALGMRAIPPGWRLRAKSKVGTGTGLSAFLFESRSKVVIAFRGTDQARDWFHNLALPVQYGPARRAVASAMKTRPDREFVITGHSLGGGLALALSRYFPKATIIAFNPSPRAPIDLNLDESALRYVVNERFDVLEILRLTFCDFVRRVVGQDQLSDHHCLGLTTTARTYNFDSGFAILRQHSMESLAMGLLTIGAPMNAAFQQTLGSVCSGTSGE